MFFSTHRRRKKEAGWWAFVNYMLYDINERAKKCIQRTDPAKVHRGENLINVHSINLELNYYTFLNHDFLLLEQWNKKIIIFSEEKAKNCFPFCSFLELEWLRILYISKKNVLTSMLGYILKQGKEWETKKYESLANLSCEEYSKSYILFCF